MNLERMLKRHKLWLQGKRGGERADLRETNLRGAELQNADLENADLENADLRGADLRGANLDMSSGIPFSCRGTEIIGAAGCSVRWCFT
jgi:uncharacterized protein YjbI with pentapeptide repeats